MIKDQHKETMDTLKDKGFALAAFLYEMDNHESRSTMMATEMY